MLDIAAVMDLDFDLDPRTLSGAVSHKHAYIAARLDSWATALAELRASTCPPTLFCPNSPTPPARANTQDSSYALPELAWPLRPHVAVAPEASSFMPVICVSHRALSMQGRAPYGRIFVQGSGDNYELWGQVCYHTFPQKSCIDKMMMIMGSSTNRGTTGPTAL